MRRTLTLLLGTLALAPPSEARAADVPASPPQSLSVIIYRNPDRVRGSVQLDALGGFAMVTETRTVHLPAGESRLRFEGVVDGIEPESAIVTGLPSGVIEKNQDAAVLSPEALVKATVGGAVILTRTDPKTGKVSRERATIRSAGADGVVFETAQGVEALRCSGLPETFSFERVPAGLSSKPTLSVLTRSPREVTATVTLSYLAENFDWGADYVARINPGGKTLNLSGWITLANGNSVSLANANTQIVAGRLNLVSAGGDASDENSSSDAQDVIATCWPQGTTSGHPPGPVPPPPEAVPAPAMAATEVGAVIVTAEKRSARAGDIAPEQLGDLKLYRLPETTTVAANQSKQVRLLEHANIPFARIATISLAATGTEDLRPTWALLRTKNSLANHLGLPLPAGHVTLLDHGRGRDLMAGVAGLKDTALDEEIELSVGRISDVQVSQATLDAASKTAPSPTLGPKLRLAALRGDTVEEVTITNARPTATPFELRLYTDDAERVTAADHVMGTKDGRPIFRLTLPANGTVKVRYTVSQ